MESNGGAKDERFPATGRYHGTEQDSKEQTYAEGCGGQLVLSKTRC